MFGVPSRVAEADGGAIDRGRETVRIQTLLRWVGSQFSTVSSKGQFSTVDNRGPSKYSPRRAGRLANDLGVQACDIIRH